MKCAREGCSNYAMATSRYCREHMNDKGEKTVKKSETENVNFKEVYAKAMAAAREAGAAATPAPMVVQQHENMLDDHSPVKKSYYVSDGVCGFAWVWFPKINTPFTRWLRSTNLAYKHYGTGCDVSMSSIGNQSLERKEAAARAFVAKVHEFLPEEKMYVQSRID